MIQLLSGALIFAYLISGVFFLRFWKQSRDRLFLNFAVAFWLFMLNQLALSVPPITDRSAGYEYLLRVLGFVLILVAILDKNVRPPRDSAVSGFFRGGRKDGTREK